MRKLTTSFGGGKEEERTCLDSVVEKGAAGRKKRRIRLWLEGKGRVRGGPFGGE